MKFIVDSILTILLALAITHSGVAMAATTVVLDAPSWQANCQFTAQQLASNQTMQARHFVLRFASTSGLAAEDDMVLTLTYQDHSIVLTEVPPWHYRSLRAAKRSLSLCDQVIALRTAKDRILLLFARDGRPGMDTLALALLDPSQRQVIDFVDSGFFLSTAQLSGTVLVKQLTNGQFEIPVLAQEANEETPHPKAQRLRLSSSATTIFVQPELPIADGTYTFMHRFAEQPNTSATSNLRVSIRNGAVVVRNLGNTEVFPKGELARGTLRWHAKSRQWFIATTAKDWSAPDVGGCSDGPDVIDLIKRVYWTC